MRMREGVLGEAREPAGVSARRLERYADRLEACVREAAVRASRGARALGMVNGGQVHAALGEDDAR